MATTTPNRGYQLPAAGNKLKDDVLRLIAALGSIDADVAALLLALADKSNVGHGHGLDAITGLVAALGNKLDVGYHDALANLTDVDVAGVANGMALLRQASKWIPVALQINNIAGLETALNGKATPADITAAINSLVAAAPGALDTLNELAAALGNDPNFATTISTALGLRLRVDAAQAFSAGQKTQGRSNLGAADITTVLRHDTAQALGAGAMAQALSNLGVSTFMQGLLDETSGAALWGAMGAAANSAASGYFKLPVGVIVQYGSVNITNGGVTLNYPTAFPNACRAIVGSPAVNLDFNIGFDNVGPSSCSARSFNQSGTNAAVTAWWIALGY